MARQIIAVGSAGNDGTGDTLRSGAIKMNDNFEELYRDVSNLGVLVSDSAGGLNLEGISFDQRSVVFIGVDSPNSTPSDTNETFLRATEPTKDNIIILPDSSGTVALLSDIAKSPGVLDSQDILSFVTTGIDSSTALSLIDQNSVDSVAVINLIDTTYINNRVDPGLDSTLTRQEIDTYVTKSYLVTNNIVLDSALVLDIISSQAQSAIDSIGFNLLAQALEVSLIPDSDNTKTLGSNTNRFTSAFLKQSLEIDSARLSYNTTFNSISFNNTKTFRIVDGSDSSRLTVSSTSSNSGAIRLTLGQFANSSLPTDGVAGDLIIISDGDSATGGPTLAFKDSNNGNYIKFNTA